MAMSLNAWPESSRTATPLGTSSTAASARSSLFGGSWPSKTIEVTSAPVQWLRPFTVDWIGKDDPLLSPNRWLFVHCVFARLDGMLQFLGSFIFDFAAAKIFIEISQIVADIE